MQRRDHADERSTHHCADEYAPGVVPGNSESEPERLLELGAPARGVNTTYDAGGTTICGGMYTFGAYTYGGARPLNRCSGHLSAMRISRTSGSVGITIKNFADEQTINGGVFMLVYAGLDHQQRVGEGDRAARRLGAEPGPALDTVAGGQTSNHDFVVAVDNFGNGAALPTGSTLFGGAPSYDAAYIGRLADLDTFSLPEPATSPPRALPWPTRTRPAPTTT